MTNSSLDYMHRLLAESLYRGYSGGRPSHEEATILAAHSVRWFRELLLRLSIQSCIEQADPVADAVAELDRLDQFDKFDAFKPFEELEQLEQLESCGPPGQPQPRAECEELRAAAQVRTPHRRSAGPEEARSFPSRHQLRTIHSRDELLWDALCEGRLVLRVEGSEVNASVVEQLSRHLVH